MSAEIRRGKFRPDPPDALSFNATDEERDFVHRSMQTIAAGECDWCQFKTLLVMGVYDDNALSSFTVARVLQEIDA